MIDVDNLQEVSYKDQGLHLSEEEKSNKRALQIWSHFDATKDEKVIKMPQFMRFLASDQYMSLQPCLHTEINDS